MSTPESRGACVRVLHLRTHSPRRQRSGSVNDALNVTRDIWVWQNEALQKLARNWGKIWNYSLESFKKEDHLLSKMSLAFSSSTAVSSPLSSGQRWLRTWAVAAKFP